MQYCLHQLSLTKFLTGKQTSYSSCKARCYACVLYRKLLRLLSSFYRNLTNLFPQLVHLGTFWSSLLRTDQNKKVCWDFSPDF